MTVQEQYGKSAQEGLFNSTQPRVADDALSNYDATPTRASQAGDRRRFQSNAATSRGSGSR